MFEEILVENTCSCEVCSERRMALLDQMIDHGFAIECACRSGMVNIGDHGPDDDPLLFVSDFVSNPENRASDESLACILARMSDTERVRMIQEKDQLQWVKSILDGRVTSH